MENSITLTRTAQGWMARFEGPHAAEIRDLFKTTTLPTPFMADADSFDVQDAIAKQNRGVTVRVETSSR